MSISHASEALMHALASGNRHVTAIEWARLGVPVLPVESTDGGRCTCGNANCRAPGKHPIASLAPRGVKDATTDPLLAQEWLWAAGDANIGLAMGDGLIALDLDPRHGADLAADFGLPRTFTEITGGSGEHRLYRVPKHARVPSTILSPGVELKGAASYIITAPSLHASGNLYRVIDVTAPFARFPDHLLPIAQPRKRTRESVAIDPRMADPAEVERVRSAAIRGPYGEKVRAALAGSTADFLDATPSGEEWNVARLLARYTDDDCVIAAILLDSNLDRAKLRKRGYLSRTLYAARHWEPPLSPANDVGRKFPRASHSPPTGQALSGVTRPPPTGGYGAHCDYDALIEPRSLSQGTAPAVLAVITGLTVRGIDRVDGWTCLRVGEIAAGIGVHRTSVLRAINRLAELGLIDTTAEPHHLVTGGVQSTRLVRLKGDRPS